LSLSSTDNEYKKYCPNYLLIWEAINFLKENDFVYFNLGLLNYVGCPEPDIERVAFFKKKWGGEEIIVRDDGGLLKLIYYKFFKRFKIFKFFIYYFKKIFVWKK
jgi:lipid II:glycine glycyltransferase (peptidoglycan interpeptide bridge formation enzyme)